MVYFLSSATLDNQTHQQKRYYKHFQPRWLLCSSYVITNGQRLYKTRLYPLSFHMKNILVFPKLCFIGSAFISIIIVAVLGHPFSFSHAADFVHISSVITYFVALYACISQLFQATASSYLIVIGLVILAATVQLLYVQPLCAIWGILSFALCLLYYGKQQTRCLLQRENNTILKRGNKSAFFSTRAVEKIQDVEHKKSENIAHDKKAMHISAITTMSKVVLLEDEIYVAKKKKTACYGKQKATQKESFQSKYLQLKEQFQEQRNILQQTRKELFTAQSNEITLHQKIREYEFYSLYVSFHEMIQSMNCISYYNDASEKDNEMIVEYERLITALCIKIEALEYEKNIRAHGF